MSLEQLVYYFKNENLFSVPDLNHLLPRNELKYLILTDALILSIT